MTDEARRQAEHDLVAATETDTACIVAAPSLAEQARTALAVAIAATLKTSGCRVPRTLTLVSIQDQPDGRPLVHLDGASPTVRLLATVPVATVSIAAPAPFRALDLTGPFQHIRSDRDGCRAYRLSLLSARFIGSTSIPVSLGAFHAAEPDPLRLLAPAALNHLEAAHADELLACVRAHGYLADVVVPRGLDRYGVELALISAQGVRLVRLPFPGGPVENLEQVAAGLRLLLTCRCGGRSQHR